MLKLQKVLLSSAIAAFLTVVVLAANAAEPYRMFNRPPTCCGGLVKTGTGRFYRDTFDVRMEVLVHGQPLPKVERNAKTYIAVPRLGVDYEILLSNNGTRRVLFIVAVDGLSVMNGQVASDKSSGYVLSPKSSYRIKGWRRGNDKVAGFSFTKPDASYAAATGRPTRIGSIRLIAIEEQAHFVMPRSPAIPRWPLGETRWRPSRPSASAPLTTYGSARNSHAGSFSYGRSYGATPKAPSVGTGYGRELDDRVQSTEFRRSGNVKRVTLYYATEGEIEAMSDELTPSENFTPPPPGYSPS